MKLLYETSKMTCFKGMTATRLELHELFSHEYFLQGQPCLLVRCGPFKLNLFSPQRAQRDRAEELKTRLGERSQMNYQLLTSGVSPSDPRKYPEVSAPPRQRDCSPH